MPKVVLDYMSHSASPLEDLPIGPSSPEGIQHPGKNIRDTVTLVSAHGYAPGSLLGTGMRDDQHSPVPYSDKGIIEKLGCSGGLEAWYAQEPLGNPLGMNLPCSATFAFSSLQSISGRDLVP